MHEARETWEMDRGGGGISCLDWCTSFHFPFPFPPFDPFIRILAQAKSRKRARTEFRPRNGAPLRRNVIKANNILVVFLTSNHTLETRYIYSSRDVPFWPRKPSRFPVAFGNRFEWLNSRKMIHLMDSILLFRAPDENDIRINHSPEIMSNLLLRLIFVCVTQIRESRERFVFVRSGEKQFFRHVFPNFVIVFRFWPFSTNRSLISFPLKPC